MGIIFKMLEECKRTGQTPEQVDARWQKEAKKLVKQDPKGKSWGNCGSCDTETALVKEVGLCGPCCFGESETAYGNW